ncbi:hypothetical protein Y1Q_0007831 [Alligator mississippiensis]|uniref:Uncharacterized protein n=1 Tax=Alligator mississippiensis TaxID=8496 RepID=A0A151N777_ALLMI|nr:hypothetical protein Y1Q_0007831 [Alligator mississippiensis]
MGRSVKGLKEETMRDGTYIFFPTKYIYFSKVVAGSSKTVSLEKKTADKIQSWVGNENYSTLRTCLLPQ